MMCLSHANLWDKVVASKPLLEAEGVVEAGEYLEFPGKLFQGMTCR